MDVSDGCNMFGRWSRLTFSSNVSVARTLSALDCVILGTECTNTMSYQSDLGEGRGEMCVKQIEGRHARRLSTWPRHSSSDVPGLAAREVQEDSGVQHAISDREIMFAMRTIRWHYSAQDLLWASCSSAFLRRGPGVMDAVRV